MTMKVQDAVKLVDELPLESLIKLSLGESKIISNGCSFELVNANDLHKNVLFDGGEDWLDCHVPDYDRNSEALRKYITRYIREMYKYVIEYWDD